MNEYLRKYGPATAILAIAVTLIMFGLFHARANAGVRGYGQGFTAYPCQRVAFPCQQVAFPSNCLTLQIGVTLAGRGEVIDIVPGSPAARAGIMTGDVINRINGR